MSWLQSTRIQLPLRQIQCRFFVSGDIATVEIDQEFEQSAREPLEVLYTFPLPAEAAVFRCELHVNGRVIRAVVMERQEALRLVQEKKEAGFRTALVEMDRENLFTLSLGNAAPGDHLKVHFAYVQPLERLGSQLSLRIPFCPGLRYIPGATLLRENSGRGAADDTDQVGDASRLSPPRIGSHHPDATLLSLQGTLDSADVDLTTISSPSHPTLIRPEASTLAVRLADQKEAPDADFVLRWSEPVTQQAVARCWMTRDDTATYALLQLRAPATAPQSEDYSLDVYFLVDRSGSMEGDKWLQSTLALQSFVHELGPKDRVWITVFESHHQDFSDKPMPRSELMKDKNFLNLRKMGVDGGTELLPALTHIFDKIQIHSRDRKASIVLITDGQVGNEAAILQAARKHPEVSIHCFGIDTAVNDALLSNLAAQQGGRCTLMTPEDDITGAVRSLAECLRQPVLTHLRLAEGWTRATGAGSLADLHAKEVLTLAVQGPPGALSTGVTAQSPSGEPWSCAFDGALLPNSPAPRLIWSRQRLRHLLNTGKRPQAIALAQSVNLVCEGASFVAWDETEKVTVARREVYQPAMEEECYDAMAMPVCAGAAAPPPSPSPAAPMQAPSPSGGSGGAGGFLSGLGKKLRGFAGTTRSLPPSPPTQQLFREEPTLVSRMLCAYAAAPTDAELQNWASRFATALKSKVSEEAMRALSGLLLSRGEKSALLRLITGLESPSADRWAILLQFITSQLKGDARTDAMEWISEYGPLLMP